MRDIRRPYHNLNSNTSSTFREKEKMKELEEFENEDFNDIEFDTKGVPIMKAKNHFGIDGVEKKNKDGYDLLKRGNYLSSSSRNRKLNTTYKKFSFKFRFVLILFLVIVAGSVFYIWTFIFGKSLIIISPKYKDIEVNETFDFNISSLLIATSSASSSKIILKSAPKEINRKAGGEIIIYNNYSNMSQKLIKNTRFKTPDGKVFRISDSIFIPGKIGNIPGSIKTKVFADTYGSEYNIGPSDFTIPGFKGMTKFMGFYAKSVASMTGGSSGFVTVVDEKDIESAKNDLSIKNKDKLNIDLKNLTYTGYVGLKDDVIYEDFDNTKDLLDLKNNIYTLTSNFKVPFIPLKTLAKTLSQSIMGNNEQDFRLDDTNGLKFTINKNVDLSNENATVTILIIGKARLISDYDKPKLINSLLSQDKTEFRKIMQKYSNSFADYEYKLYPSWQRNFPDKSLKIKILEDFK